MAVLSGGMICTDRHPIRATLACVLSQQRMVEKRRRWVLTARSRSELVQWKKNRTMVGSEHGHSAFTYDVSSIVHVSTTPPGYTIVHTDPNTAGRHTAPIEHWPWNFYGRDAKSRESRCCAAP